MTDQNLPLSSSPAATATTLDSRPAPDASAQGQAGGSRPPPLPVPETPSTLTMQALATPNPLLGVASAGTTSLGSVTSGGDSTSSSSSSSSSDEGEEEGEERDGQQQQQQQQQSNGLAGNDNRAAGPAPPLQPAPQTAPAGQQPTDQPPPQVVTAVNRMSINLRALLPKKTKHGRIGGSLYRALRDAGVDVSALNIPRGRPPRHKVGQKRPKRPTLLGLIKSGAALPMLPGAPPLQLIVTEDEDLGDDELHGGGGGGSSGGTAAARAAGSPPGSAPSPATDVEVGFASPLQAATSGKGGWMGVGAQRAPTGLREASNEQWGRSAGGPGTVIGGRKRSREQMGAEEEEGDVEEEEDEAAAAEEDEAIDGMTADDAITGLLLLGKE